MRCSERTVEAAPGWISTRRRTVRTGVEHQCQRTSVAPAPAECVLILKGQFYGRVG